MPFVKYIVYKGEKYYPVREDALGYFFPWKDDKNQWHEGFINKYDVEDKGELELL